MRSPYKNVMATLETLRGLVVISLISAIGFLALGYTLVVLPFCESLLVNILAYGTVTFGAWALFIYWGFFEKLGTNKQKTRFELQTGARKNSTRAWIGIIFVAGSGYASYSLGYVASRVTYWPHKLLASDSAQYRAHITSIDPYTSGMFRNYVSVEIESNNANFRIHWPKNRILQVSGNQMTTSDNLCVTLQSSLLGISVMDMTPCS